MVSILLHQWARYVHTEDLVANIVLANEVSQKFLVHTRLVDNLSSWVRHPHLTEGTGGLNSRQYPRKCIQAR